MFRQTLLAALSSFKLSLRLGKLLAEALDFVGERLVERRPAGFAEMPMERELGALDLVEGSVKHGHHDLVCPLVEPDATDATDGQRPHRPSALIVARALENITWPFGGLSREAG
jgi:hypothetical protein